MSKNFVLLEDNAATSLQPKPNAETKTDATANSAGWLLCIGGFVQQHTVEKQAKKQVSQFRSKIDLNRPFLLGQAPIHYGFWHIPQCFTLQDGINCLPHSLSPINGAFRVPMNTPASLQNHVITKRFKNAGTN